MSTTMPPVPYFMPMTDKFGVVTPIWSDWFRSMFLRAGGNISSTNDELYSVSAVRIESDAVTTAKILDLNVTTAKLALEAVTTAKLALEAVTTAKIADLNVTTGKLALEAVGFAQLLGTDWTKVTTASGYQKLPSGVYIQWGVTASINSATNTGQTFPIAFPTACRQVVAGIKDNSAAATTTTGAWGTGNYSTTGFDMYNRTSVANVFNWFAVGV